MRTLSHPILRCPAVSGLVTFTCPQCIELLIRGHATGRGPVVSVQCTMSTAPQLRVCVFIRGDSSTQWNKDTVNHNQMGVCAGGGGEGGEGDLRRSGEESVCPECSGDAKTQCGTLKAKGSNWVGGFLAARGGGVSHLGK